MGLFRGAPASRTRGFFIASVRFCAAKIKPQLNVDVAARRQGRWIMDYVMSVLAVGFVAAMLLGLI